MKIINYIFILICLFPFSDFCRGQTIGKPVKIMNGIGISFIQDEQVLNPKELLLIMSENHEAFKIMQKAQNHYVASRISFGAGGALVAYQLILASTGGNTDNILTGAGAGLLLLGIPFNCAYKKNAKRAVGIYNRGLDSIEDEIIGKNIGVELRKGSVYIHLKLTL